MKNTVHAKLIITTQTAESKGLISIQITDFSTKQLLAHEKFERKYIWENSWGKYNGDSRALSDKQLKICENQAVLPPSQQELFLEFTKPIFRNASNYLIQF